MEGLEFAVLLTLEGDNAMDLQGKKRAMEEVELEDMTWESKWAGKGHLDEGGPVESSLHLRLY